MPQDYRTYFRYVVLGELLDLDRFRDDCIDCHDRKAARGDTRCEYCDYASLPMCSCGGDVVMGHYTEMCADCFWEEDYQYKRHRRQRLYADPEAFEAWRQHCASVLGVAYTPMPEQDRLAMLAKYQD